VGKKFLLLAVSVMVSVAFTAGVAFGSPVRIVVTDNGWDSQQFHNHVAKFIVENAFDGFVLEMQTATSTMNWLSMIAGDVDLDIESWTDNVATFEDDVANGDVIPLGILVEDSAQGFFVPRFVIEGSPERGIEPMAPTLREVADLIRYPHVFRDPEEPARGRIYGAPPGWMADEVMHATYRYHGLDESFIYFRVGSEAVLFASLESAYNLGDAWVGYLYAPSWVTGRLDVVMLEAAPFVDLEQLHRGATEFPRQALRIVSSNRFADRAPALVDFFSRYNTGAQRVSEALAFLEETGASHENAAIWFLRNNDSLLDEWLEPEQADRVRTALANR